MLPLLLRALLVAVVVWWVLVALGVRPTPFARTMIRIRNGEIRVDGAALTPRVREHLADVVREAMIFKGFITLSSRSEVRFSRNLPASMHQRLRNILLN